MEAESTQKQRSSAMRARHDFVRWIKLWHDFLVLSPSYELARRCRAGELSGTEALPDDFDAVLSVYDDLGAVTFLEFSEWWQEVRFRYFGFGGDRRPAIVGLGIIDENADEAGLAKIGDALKAYHTQQWDEQGQPSSLIAAIPLGLPKAQLIRQITNLLNGMPVGEQIAKRAMNAKYTLTGAKLHRDSIVRYRDCLLAKARMPKAPLWRIGSAANLSDTYGGRLKPQVARAYSHEDQMADREAMKFLAGRAVKRGYVIAENAARGIFPSYKPCQFAMPLDLDRVERQRQERLAETKRRRAGA